MVAKLITLWRRREEHLRNSVAKRGGKKAHTGTSTYDPSNTSPVTDERGRERT